MAYIDYEKLIAKSYADALDDFDHYLDNPRFDSDYARWLEENLNRDEQLKIVQNGLFAKNLIQNYHNVLAEMLKLKGIDLNAL